MESHVSEPIPQLPCPEGADKRTCARIAEFNCLAADLDVNKLPRLLDESQDPSPACRELELLYGAADALSIEAAVAYRRTMALLAVAGTVLTLAFLLYDEAELFWMIWLVGAMLVWQVVLRRAAKRSRSHRHYLEYRVLAEFLRVQVMLRHAGSALKTTDLLTWSQRDDMPWVTAALDALDDAPVGVPHDISDCWVGEQRRYHQNAVARSQQAVAYSDRVVRLSTMASMVLYVIALAFELLCGGLLGQAPLSGVPVDVWRAVLKIALGGLSAATLFVSAYYGSLSLPRVLADHERLARFYAQAEEWLAEQSQGEELLARIAREELAENSNWYSYQQDNVPDINV